MHFNFYSTKRILTRYTTSTCRYWLAVIALSFGFQLQHLPSRFHLHSSEEHSCREILIANDEAANEPKRTFKLKIIYTYISNIYYYLLHHYVCINGEYNQQKRRMSRVFDPLYAVIELKISLNT